MKAAFVAQRWNGVMPPWPVQLHVAIAVLGVLAGLLMTFHPIGFAMAAGVLFYLVMTAAFVLLRSALLRFLMTGFHIATAGLGIAALLLVPEALQGDPWITARCTLVIGVSAATIVLQWLPATSRWLDPA